MSNDYLMGFLTRGEDMGIRIKSIQSGLITVGGNTTINEVVPAKTMLILGGLADDYATAWDTWTMVQLSSSIVINVTGYVASPRVTFAAIEFELGVSVQRGVTQLEAAETLIDVTVNEVNPEKAVLSQLGSRSYGGKPYRVPRARLLNPTTVRIEKLDATAWGQLSWELIEFI